MNKHFLAQIKTHLTDQSWPWVLSALRQDSLVWETLLANDAALQMPADSPSLPEKWNPAWVAFQSLGWDIPDPNKTLSIGLRQRAFHTYEVITQRRDSVNMEITPIAQASLLALALRERLRLTGKWGNLVEELTLAPINIWRTPLACLYGLIEKPTELLRTLLIPNPPAGIYQLALHALFCNPIQPETQVDLLKILSDALPISDKQDLLNHIFNIRPSVATEIARGVHLPSQVIESGSLLKDLTVHCQHADIALIANSSAEAKSAIDNALTKNRLLQAKLAAQYAEISDTPLIYWQKAFEYAPELPAYRARLALALIDADNLTDARVILDPSENPGHPDLYYAMARLAQLSDELDQARQFANQASTALNDHWNTVTETTETPPPLTLAISKFLLAVNLPSAAIQAARYALRERTDDPERFMVLGKAQTAAGQPKQAAEAFQWATLLAPYRIDLHRILAESLEACDEWGAALEEREFVALAPRASLEDQYALIDCALHNQQTDYAIEICNDIFAKNPADGMAHTLMGEALASQNDWTAAREHFTQASELTPDLPRPWLSLARAYNQNNEPQKALETLRIACQAIPTAAQVHQELGEQYLSTNSPTQALAAFKRANELEPQNIPVALRYGETLYQLGHLPQAHQILQQAYQQDHTNSQVAHIYAKILLGQEDPKTALLPLETVVASNPTDPTPYVDYARALLLTDGDPTKATQAIQHALKLDPDYNEAKAILGEALAAQQDYPAAMQAYQAALEYPNVYSVASRAQLSYGLGCVAIYLGKIEIAIAALLEAVQLDPQNYRPHCKLAEAYQTIKLIPDAYQSAREALRLAGDDLPVMIWYAEKALSLSDQDSPNASAGTQHTQIHAGELHHEAIQILERASEIAANQTEMLLRISEIQIMAGEAIAAANNLRQIANINATTPNELQQAAQTLLRLDDADGAAICLEKALVISQNQNQDPSFKITLLTQLSNAYHQAGQPKLALEKIEKAAALAPTDAGLCHTQASLLVELGQFQTALDLVEATLAQLPDPSLHHLAGCILRTQGKLEAAREHAEAGVRFGYNPDDETMERGQQLSTILAAEISLALLQQERAEEILQTQAENITGHKQSLIIPFIILQAEVALSKKREIEAVNLLGKPLIDPECHSPRQIALQARLTAYRGDLKTGLDLFQKAIQYLEDYDPENSSIARLYSEKRADQPTQTEPFSMQSILYPLIETAIELNIWGIALRLAQRSIQIAPAEPLAHLYLARVLVQRAEFQNLCSAADVIHQAPGPVALSEGTRNTFEQTIQYLTGMYSGDGQESPLPELPSALLHWKYRGTALFSPSEDSALAFETWSKQNHDTEAIAASFAILRETGKLNILPTDPVDQRSAAILTQLALLFEPDTPQEAIKVLQLAILNEPVRNIQYAIRNYILARIARQIDYTMALPAIQVSIAILPEEPRWRALAAKIYMDSGDKNNALSHLERAIQLEPHFIEHQLALGSLYLQFDDGSDPIQNALLAVKCLERATRIAPDRSEAWLVLAQAHRQAGNLDQAVTAAETAVTLAIDPTAPHLMLAEMASQTGNHQAAYDHALTAHRLQPDSVEAALLLSNALQALGRPAEALTVIDESIPESNQNLTLKLERIMLVRKSRGPQAALQAAVEISQIYPDDPEVLAILAEAQSEASQEELAIRSAQKAILLGENLSVSHQASLRLLLGNLLRKNGQLDQAVHHLDEAIRLEPGQIDAYLELGRTHQDRRQQSQALLMYRKAASIAPHDPRPYLQAGLALKDGKDYVEAESMLRRAADLAPEDTTIRRQLAAVIAINLIHSPRRVSQTETL